MSRRYGARSNKRRFFIGGLVAVILVIVNLLLLSTLSSEVQARQSQVNSPKTKSSTSTSSSSSSSPVLAGADGSPNVVTNFFGVAANFFEETVDSSSQKISYAAAATGEAAVNGTRSTGKALAASGNFIVNGLRGSAKAVASATGSGVNFVAGAVSGGFSAVIHVPGAIFATLAHLPSMSSVIRPGVNLKLQVIVPDKALEPPTSYAVNINLPKPSLKKVNKPRASKVNKPKKAESPAVSSAVQWPIHGEITTEFGVPEPPYEPIHTGLDISDGEPPGVTPIRPFKAGKVIAVIHGGGLGNHVIVDNGGGITSIYGHMSSTAVSVGEVVNLHTVLGYEGSTGVSTGPHLHFEIRVNGAPEDPHKFIPGEPYN